MKKERTQITQGLCDHVKILLAGGANVNKAAEITGTGHATISRIKAAGFSAETYRKNQLKQKEKEKKVAEEQLTGQMQMDLQAAEEQKAEMSDQTKLMRFQAAQADKICEKITKQAVIINETLLVKLDRLNDTLCQILRAVRKE
ncbi:MAG: hypothetical protein J6U01_10990 [Clostridia bacterium]|nr:hypothetical protein [Clostridia bacterium]